MPSITGYAAALAATVQLATAVDCGACIPGAYPDKPALEPDIRFADQVAVLNKSLKQASWQATQWPAGWLPQSCKDSADRYGLNYRDFVVHIVTYDDCDDPTVICRHVDAVNTADDTLDVRIRGSLKLATLAPVR